MVWLPIALKQLLQQIADGGNLPDLTNISQAEAREMLQEFAKVSTDFSAAVADLFTSITAGSLVQQAGGIEGQFSRIAQKYPKLASTGKLMFVLSWIGALANVGIAVRNGSWEKLSPVQKVQFVTSCVQYVVQAFDAVPMIYRGASALKADGWKAITDAWSAPPPTLPKTSEPSGEIELQDFRVANDMPAAVTQLGKGTFYAKVFGEGILSGAVKLVGSVCAVMMAGLAAWQLYDDISSGASISTDVFDALPFASQLGTSVCVVLDLVFAASSIFPVVGAIIAIVGVLIDIIAGFFEKPVNPVDQWMQDYGLPFASSLPAPTSTISVPVAAASAA